MIIVEDRLREILASLPVIQIDGVDFPHRFDFGSSEDLNILIKQEERLYPLIWLETGFEETHNLSKNEVSVSLSLKIATSSPDNALLNQERLNYTFKEVIFPTLDNVRKTFERSNVVQLQDTDWDITKFYNYGSGTKTETTHFWDAVKFDVDLTINNDCIKPFNYG